MQREVSSMSVAGFLFVWFIVIAIGVSWITNVVFFFQEDFASPYKGEVIHAIGIFIPILSPITVWF